MFACNACANQHKRLTGEPRIAVVSGGPGVDLEPLLSGFKQHQAVSLINLGSRYLPGNDVPVAAEQRTTPDRLRNAVGLAVTAARSGMTPIIALPHDPWFAATHAVMDHLRREGVPTLHAHLFRPLGEATHDEAALLDFGLMYRAAPNGHSAAGAAHMNTKELTAALSKAAPAVKEFLKAALLPDGATNTKVVLRTHYPSDLVLAAHIPPKKNVSLVLQKLAEASVPQAHAAPIPAQQFAPLSGEWLKSAGLGATNLAIAPEITDPPVHLLTYLSKNFADTGHGKFWVATAEKYGYDYTILGTDSDWPGLGTKIRRYYDFLLNSPYADTDIIVVTDADDVVLNVTPSELLQRYEKVRNGKELVVSTEWDHIWPNRIVLPGHEQERYPSINVGLFCGTKRALLSIYQWELRDGFNEDQIRFKDYIDANGTDAFTIDYHHELFSCMREDYQADLNVLDSGVLEVGPFHTVPAAVHFPGPMGKSLFAKIQTKLVEMGSVRV